MKLLLSISFLIPSLIFFSQANLEKIKELELEAVTLLHEARKFNTLPEQHEKNQAFEEKIRELMEYNETFTHDFDTLAKLISTIKSPDGAFRIFNWNMEYGDFKEHKYYCLMMKKDPKSGEFVIIELFDHSADFFEDVEFKALTDKKWYGCLYYSIIPIQKGFKTQYTLLGWDGNNMLSNKKIIETMKFNKKDELKFGEAMFKSEEDKTKRRVIFEYTEEATMSVKYQKTKKIEMIVYDHLSSIVPGAEDISHGPWSGPDGSYDGYVLENGKWVRLKDVDARTDKKFKTKYNAPKENR